MDTRSYLPSSQFSVIVVSVALAGGLILGAQYITAPKATSGALLAAGDTPTTSDWQASLEAIQAEAPGLPAAPSEDTVQKLRDAAQSSNITSSVARSLFVNLGAAGAQGLGNDIPTQEKLIAEASAQVETGTKAAYSTGDLTVATQSSASLRVWGNAVMSTFLKHPRANNGEALLAIGKAADYGDASALAPLTAISAAYASLAADLADIEVPATLLPLYLQLINNLARMSEASKEMKTVISDPLRGLSGLQAFQAAGGEASRVLTTLAEQLAKGGILFSKDEPGAGWSVFVSSYSQ